MDRALAAHGPAAVSAALGAYLTEARKARIEEVIHARLHGVAVAVEDPYDPHNAAAVVRSAEITGAVQVHVIRASARILRSRGITSGAFRWVETHHHAELGPFVEHLHGQGMLLAGACVDGDLPLEQLPCDRPLCLIFGNEHAGLSPEARERCDLRFRLAMHGFTESYNLSVSAALGLYTHTARYRAQLGRRGDAGEAQLELMRARYYGASVDARLVEGLFVTPESDGGDPSA